MELLDLPPEIFQKIIASYVHTVGVCKAWERRKVCKTFAAFISEECFGRQPMTKYAHPAAKKLFLQHLRLFLEYRCENLHGAPALLPNLVRNVVDDLMTATKETSVSARSAYMDRVCNAIQRCCPEAFNLATNPSPVTCHLIASDPVASHCLLIAIWMKDKQLISHYLSCGVSVWEPTEAFEWPLLAAVRHSAAETVPQLLKYAKGGLGVTTKIKPVKVLDYASARAIVSKDWDTAITLIDWWYQHCRKPHPDQVVAWVREAVNAQATEFLHRALDQKITVATKKRLIKCLFDEHYAWGADSLDVLAGAMIDRNFLDVSQFYDCKWTGWSGSLLALAVKLADIELAKLCLKKGMSADGLQSAEGKLENPLVTAVQIGDEAMVRLLLDYNANPTPAQNLVLLGKCEPGHEIVKRVDTLIRKAMKSKSSEADTDI